MDSSDLRKLQLIELKILLDVKKTCDSHNIKYYLMGGTLLGAVRHHGFIPWDDDIDICMLRDDYERFINIAQDELGSDYFLQTWMSDSGFGNTFTKVKLIGTEYSEPLTENCTKNKGIFIDVFPYDTICNPGIRRKLFILSCQTLERMSAYKAGYSLPESKSAVQALFRVFCKCLSVFFSRERILKTRERHLQKYNSRNTAYLYDGARLCTPKEYFAHRVSVDFEGFEFTAMEFWHEYLTLCFGNYMEIPPVEKRPLHGNKTPVFGKYAAINSIQDILADNK